MLHANTQPHRELEALLPAHAWQADFDQATVEWHSADTGAEHLHLQLHLANFELWHLEDRARDPHATDSAIAGVKRAIDRTNQRRNDFVEQLDAALLAALQPHTLPNPDAPLHSETPGMIADRLSILSLKCFHMREESQRTDASPAHRDRSGERLAILNTQSSALAGCLADLWHEIVTGTRRFAVYHQMKMYNDPTLNPVLYAASNPPPTTGS